MLQDQSSSETCDSTFKTLNISWHQLLPTYPIRHFLHMLQLNRNSQSRLDKALNIVCAVKWCPQANLWFGLDTWGVLAPPWPEKHSLFWSSCHSECHEDAHKKSKVAARSPLDFLGAANFSFLCTLQLLRRACKPNSLSKDVRTYVRIWALSLPAGISSQKNILGPAALYHFLLRNWITVLLLLKCQMFTSTILNWYVFVI